MHTIVNTDETAELEKEERIARKKLDAINPAYAEKIMMGKSLDNVLDTCTVVQEFRRIYQKLRVLRMHSQR